MSQRDRIIQEIIDERIRQFNLPGIEYDVSNSPNDWIAIASSYCARSVTRKNVKPTFDDFKQDLTMAAAVLVAALEHLDQMKEKGFFE